MKHEDLISVITPMFNAEKYILETIQSVIDQSYQNWEMIIVDNYSTDTSREIVENVDDDRIKLIKLDFNSGGPARPRNQGLENAHGEYIAFLDADDVWLNNKLEKQISILKDNNYDIIHSLAYTIDTNSKPIGTLNNQNLYNKLKYFLEDKTISYFSNFININTVLMKKDLNIKFKEEKYIAALEDSLFWIEHLNSGKKSYLVNENLINYRIVNTSASNRSSDKSYRKFFYLYSILLNDEKISLKLFIMCSILNIVKISVRNLRNIFK